MELAYKLLQIGALLFHFVIIFKRYASRVVTKRAYGNLGTAIQVFLCTFMISELSEPFWEFKKWYWFLFDYALALHFYLSYREHYNYENGWHQTRR